MEAASRNSLLLVEHFQIRSQENSVFFDCSCTRKITISSLNDLAIYLFLIEQTGELSEILIDAKAADNHLRSQLNASNKFWLLTIWPPSRVILLTLAVCVSVLLLWFVWLFLIVWLLSLLCHSLLRVDGDLLGRLIIFIVVLLFLFILGGVHSFVKGDDKFLNGVAILLSFLTKFVDNLN